MQRFLQKFDRFTMRLKKWSYFPTICGLCMFVIPPFTKAIPIDNGVVGYPDVTCGPHSIIVDVTTEKPFNGRLFVKGESDVPGCSTGNYGDGGGGGPYHDPGIGAFGGPPPYDDGPAYPLKKQAKTSKSRRAAPPYGPSQSTYGGSRISFELAFGQCNMRRQRTLYPKGVEYTFTLVVSFHPLFITKIDRAYRVRCFYMEAEKTVNQQLEVSMLTTAGLEQQFPMPTCRYHIKRGSYDGPYVRFAKVGDKVFHVWECDEIGAYIYGMLVKNCYVDDGKGNKFMLIDERGCANDIHLVPNLTYDPKLLKAYVETHVFKYADYPQLYFQCTIQLCFKADGGCDGITPPQCGYGAPPPPTYNQGPPPYAGPPVHAVGPPNTGSYIPGPGPFDIGPSPGGFIVGGDPYGPYRKDSPVHDDSKRRQQKTNGTVKTVGNDSATEHVTAGLPAFITAASTATTYAQTGPLKRTTARLTKEFDFTDKRHKRDINGEEVRQHPSRDFLETDVSSQSVIVLPFDEDDDFGEDIDTNGPQKNSERRFYEQDPYYALVHGNHILDRFQGFCLSPSGFGIMLALFITLFIFSTILTVILLRSHWKYRSKIGDF